MAFWSPRRHPRPDDGSLWKATGTGTELAVAALASTSAAPAVSIDSGRAMTAQGMGNLLPFAPGAPIGPFFGQGVPPRRFDYTTGRNINARPRSDTDISFETMHELIRCYDFAQICIRHRIDDVTSLEYKVRPLAGHDDDGSAVAAAENALRRPDGKHKFTSWLRAFLNDILRYDAGCLYRQRDHADRVIGLRAVDGRTIAPMVDYFGDIPDPEAPAYQQWIMGVPFGDYTSADLIYEPMWPRTDSPYGMPPIETILLRGNTDVRFQLHFLEYFTEGSLPAGFMEAPADLSDPDKIEDIQARFDAVMAGDQTQKVKVRWVPGGSKFTAYRPTLWDPKFPKFLMGITCAAFGVVPADLGFTEDVNKASGDTQIDVQFRVGPTPLIEHVEGILDGYLQDDLGFPVHGSFDVGQEKEDRLVEAQVWQIGIQNAAASPDEFRDKVLGLPVDPEHPTPRYVFTARGGPIPLSALYAVAGEIDSVTYAPALDAVLPHTPFAPVEGLIPQPPPKSPPLATQMYGVEDDTTSVEGADDVGDGADPIAAGQALAKTAEGPTVAGLCVKAADTGRVLMLQRGLADTADPARGTWEWPGGHLEPGEGPLEAALREWEEETGIPLPAGRFDGSWTSANGVYRCFVYLIGREAAIPLNATARLIGNPDDPHGDSIETAAWWDPVDLPDMPALRPECRGSDWAVISAAGGSVAKAVQVELGRWRSNARGRVRKGHTPRRFVSTLIPGAVADAVWVELAKASTVAEVDAAFRPDRLVKRADPKAGARPGPGAQRAAEVAGHYAPKIRAALRMGIDPEALAAAWFKHGKSG